MAIQYITVAGERVPYNDEKYSADYVRRDVLSQLRNDYGSMEYGSEKRKLLGNLVNEYSSMPTGEQRDEFFGSLRNYYNGLKSGSEADDVQTHLRNEQNRQYGNLEKNGVLGNLVSQANQTKDYIVQKLAQGFAQLPALPNSFINLGLYAANRNAPSRMMQGSLEKLATSDFLKDKPFFRFGPDYKDEDEKRNAYNAYLQKDPKAQEIANSIKNNPDQPLPPEQADYLTSKIMEQVGKVLPSAESVAKFTTDPLGLTSRGNPTMVSPNPLAGGVGEIAQFAPAFLGGGVGVARNLFTKGLQEAAEGGFSAGARALAGETPQIAINAAKAAPSVISKAGGSAAGVNLAQHYFPDNPYAALIAGAVGGGFGSAQEHFATAVRLSAALKKAVNAKTGELNNLLEPTEYGKNLIANNPEIAKTMNGFGSDPKGQIAAAKYLKGAELEAKTKDIDEAFNKKQGDLQEKIRTSGGEPKDIDAAGQAVKKIIQETQTDVYRKVMDKAFGPFDEIMKQRGKPNIDVGPILDDINNIKKAPLIKDSTRDNAIGDVENGIRDIADSNNLAKWNDIKQIMSEVAGTNAKRSIGGKDADAIYSSLNKNLRGALTDVGPEAIDAYDRGTALAKNFFDDHNISASKILDSDSPATTLRTMMNNKADASRISSLGNLYPKAVSNLTPIALQSIADNPKIFSDMLPRTKQALFPDENMRNDLTNHLNDMAQSAADRDAGHAYNLRENSYWKAQVNALSKSGIPSAVESLETENPLPSFRFGLMGPGYAIGDAAWNAFHGALPGEGAILGTAGGLALSNLPEIYKVGKIVGKNFPTNALTGAVPALATNPFLANQGNLPYQTDINAPPMPPSPSPSPSPPPPPRPTTTDNP